MRRVWLVLVVFLCLCGLAWAGNSHQTGSEAGERESWWFDGADTYVVNKSTCLPLVPTASLTLDPFPCEAYTTDGTRMTYLTQDPAAVGPLDQGDGSYHIIADASTVRVLAGWTRQGLTHYLWQQSATQPAIPAGTVLVASPFVSGSIITSVTDKRPLRFASSHGLVSLTDFGAIAGDGLDDAAALRSALAAGDGSVYVPCGAYNIGSEVELPGRTFMMGCGPTSAFIHDAGSGNMFVAENLGATIQFNIILQDLGFQWGTGSGDAIHVEEAGQIRGKMVFQRNAFDGTGMGNASYGLRIVSGISTRIRDNDFVDMAGGGISLTGTSNQSSVTGNTLSNQGAGVFAAGQHDGGDDNQALQDLSKDFVALGILPGGHIYNYTDGSEATVSTVSTTILTFSPGLSGGAENDFDDADFYHVTMGQWGMKLNAPGIYVAGNLNEAWRGLGGIDADNCSDCAFFRNWFEDNAGIHLFLGTRGAGTPTGISVISNNFTCTVSDFAIMTEKLAGAAFIMNSVVPSCIFNLTSPGGSQPGQFYVRGAEGQCPQTEDVLHGGLNPIGLHTNDHVEMSCGGGSSAPPIGALAVFGGASAVFDIGRLRIGRTALTNPGTPILGHLSAGLVMDFSTLAANACDRLSGTVTGAGDSDSVTVGVPVAIMESYNHFTFQGYVSAADTVTVQRCNVSTGVSADPPSGTIRVDVWKH